MLRRLLFAALLIALLPLVPFASAQEPSPTTPAWVNGFGSLIIDHLSPDESALAVATTTGLYLYDTAQPATPPRRLDGHTDTVIGLTFSPDSTLLVSSSLDGTVRLWRVPGGDSVWSARIADPAAAPIGTAFTDDGSLLVGPTLTGGAEFVINARSGQVRMLETSFQVRRRSSDVLFVDAPDGVPVLHAITASGDNFEQHDLLTLDGVTVTEDTPISLSDDYLAVATGGSVIAMQISDGAVVARLDNVPGYPGLRENDLILDTTGNLTVVDLGTGARVDVAKQSGGYRGYDWVVYVDPEGAFKALDLHSLQSTTVAAPTPSTFWQSENYLLYPDSDGVPSLVDLASNALRPLPGITLPPDAQNVHFIAYEQTVLIAYGYGPFTVGLWDATTGDALVEPQTYDAPGQGFLRAEARAAMTAMREGSNGLLIADLAAPSLQWTPVDGYAEPRQFSASGLYYRTSRGLALLDPASGSPTRMAFDGHTTLINDIAYSPDGARLASASDDGTVRVRDTATGQTLAAVPMEGTPERVAFAGDTLFIITDGHLYTWNGSLSTAIDDFGTINDLGAAGTTLVAITDQNVLVLDGSLHPTLRRSLAPDAALPPTNGYTAVAIDAGGSYIAAAANVGSTAYPEQTIVDVWRANGAFVGRLSSPDPSYGGYVKSLSFAADGSQLALTAAETTVWNLDDVPGDPAYVVVNAYASGSTFAGSNLAVGTYGIPVGSVVLYDPAGTYEQTLQRNVHVLNAGGGGDTPREPIAGRPDGSQIAAQEFPAALVAWEVPQPTVTPSQSVIAYCDTLDGAPTGLTSAAPLDVEWSWYATELPLVLDHMNSVQYEISLDGQSLATGDAQVSTVRRDSANDNHWTVYYTLHVGPLAAGEHTLTYRATWSRVISDGLSDYGPGTAHPEDTGTCRFTVG